MLSIENLRVVYLDVISVLNGISLNVNQGEIQVIIGANGAGKTTLLRAVAGMIDFYDGDIIDGDIKMEGLSIKGLDSTDIMKRYNLTYVMEDRPVFWYLTIEENLKAASFSRWDNQVKADIEKNYDYFPVLRTMRNKRAGYASGGEQQMLAIAMALMTKPKVLLLDEPSLGLAPLGIGTRGYVVEMGRVVLDGTARELIENEDVREFYLGSGEKERKSYKDAKRYKRRKRWL
jgi:branched-chain amino acid transport system ATP-binding protein